MAVRIRIHIHSLSLHPQGKDECRILSRSSGDPPEGFFQLGRRFKAQGRLNAVAQLGQRDVRPVVVFVDLAGDADASRGSIQRGARP